jgi:hypothetical protein
VTRIQSVYTGAVRIAVTPWAAGNEYAEYGHWAPSVVKSYAVLDNVVADQRLYVKYDKRDADIMAALRVDTLFWPGRYNLVVNGAGDMMELQLRNGTVSERAPAGEPIGRSRGLLWRPARAALTPGRKVRFTVSTFRSAAHELSSRVETELSADAREIIVTYSDVDPVRAERVLNSIGERLVIVARRPVFNSGGPGRTHITDSARVAQSSSRRGQLIAAGIGLGVSALLALLTLMLLHPLIVRLHRLADYLDPPDEAPGAAIMQWH